MNLRMTFSGLLIASVIGMACCPATIDMRAEGPSMLSPEKTMSKRQIVDSITDKTVALVKKDSDGDYVPYCGGVWVGKNLILTAFHCIEEGSDQGKTEYMTYDAMVSRSAIVKDFDED